MGYLYTIGHSHHDMEEFISLLNKYNIDSLLDVRSVPYSKYAEQYNRESIKQSLSEVNIKYIFMGTYFGARQNNNNLYSQDGYLDFDKVRGYAEFKKRVESVIKGLNEGHNIVLMCTEKEPIDCHRAIMVGRAFELSNVKVEHILSNGELLSQDDLNNQLLDKYFLDRIQIDLFSEAEKEDDELLLEAYKLRNKEIGYKIDDKEDN